MINIDIIIIRIIMIMITIIIIVIIITTTIISASIRLQSNKLNHPKSNTIFLKHFPVMELREGVWPIFPYFIVRTLISPLKDIFPGFTVNGGIGNCRLDNIQQS